MIRGRTKPVNTVKRQHNIDIHNRFDIEVIDSKTNKVKQTAKAYNVVCNNMWTCLGSRSSYFQYIVYGSGNGVPSPSDTDLFASPVFVSVSNHNYTVDADNGVGWRTCKITLSETTSVGMTITEVGISSSNSAGYLVTHAMLQDMNGNQISITKTDTDIINIYATVYVHWNPGGYNGVYITGGQFYRWLFGYGYDVAPYGSWPNAYSPDLICGRGNGYWTCGRDSTNMAGTYDATTRKYVVARHRIPAGSCNCGGFGWVATAQATTSPDDAYFMADVRGVYPVYGESVGTGDGETTAFATKFDLPMNATVYVDGKIASGVTVRKEPLTLYPGDYLVRIGSKLTPDGQHIIRQPTLSLKSDSYIYLYNPLHELGLYSWSRKTTSYNGLLIAFSDDMVNWSSEYSQNTTIPEQHRHMKYLRMRCAGTSSSGKLSEHNMSFPPEVTGKQIVFDTPPAAGSVIIIDYETPFVPKDENHVYDFSLTIQFGEYTEN